MAIGVIIGAAIGKVVSSIADNVINPIIGELLPGGAWRDASIELSRTTDEAGKVSINAISYGQLIGAIVDFVIIACVVFMIARAFIPKPGERSRTRRNARSARRSSRSRRSGARPVRSRSANYSKLRFSWLLMPWSGIESAQEKRR